MSSPRPPELPEPVLARVVAELRPLEGVRALALTRTVARMRALFDSVAQLCSELYRPRFALS